MTISSCAFFFFSPVTALEMRKRTPSTGRVAANVMDVSVRSIFVVFFVSCATSPARTEGRSVSPLLVKTQRVPIGVRPCSFTDSYAQGVYTFFSLIYWINLHCLFTLWREATHPSHRRSTHGRNWPFLQDKVPPLSVLIQALADDQSESMLASIHVSLPGDTSLRGFPRINLEKLLCISSQLVRTNFQR